MSELKIYYVSLVKDLIGCYIKFQADSEEAVRQYLAHNYMTKAGEWKLPWCAVYDEIPAIEAGKAIVIDATKKAGPIYGEDYTH